VGSAQREEADVTDTQRHDAEVLVDHHVVDGVRVDFYHHKDWNSLTERVYRIVRTDTGAARMVSHPQSADPIKPALARKALAEAFVQWPDEAVDAMSQEGT
jgi:hypothetical protein